MKKKILIIVGIILVVIVLGIIIAFANDKSKTEDINEVLQSEDEQAELLTSVIEDSINRVDLGKYGEYKLSIEADSILNMLTGEIMLDSSFAKDLEIVSDNPQEYYHIRYSYNKEERVLTIDITGTFMDISTTRQLYKLTYDNGKIKYERTEVSIMDNVQ